MRKSPRILVVTSIFPNPGEVTKGIYIFRQTEALSKLTPVLVVAPVPYFPAWLKNGKYSRYASTPLKEERGGVEVLHPRNLVTPKIGRSLYGIMYFLSVLKTIMSVKKTFSPDICIGYWAFPDGFATYLFSMVLGIPSIISCRGSDVNELKPKSFRWWMVKWVLNRCDRVFAVSRAMSEVISALGVDSKGIRVIPNGVDTSVFHMTGSREDARRRAGLEFLGMRSGVILYCGRLSKEKGPDVLLEAARIMKTVGVDFHIVYAGDGPMKGALKKDAIKSALADRVSFVDERPHEEVPYLMNSCDLFCLPSLFEGWPNTLMESLACGMPAVASNVGGVPDIINSADLGILVCPGDPEALARALTEGLKRWWKREAIAESCSRRSWVNVASEILKEVEGSV